MDFIRSRSFAAVFLFAALLAACSGGGGTPKGDNPTPNPSGSGGKGTPTPKPPPTGTPYAYSLPSSSPLVPSSYSVMSNPAGLAVSVDGKASGTTPQTLSSLTYGSHTIVITPSVAASPDSFAVNENAGASHTLMYNQVVDTIGSVSGTVLPPAVKTAQRRANIRKLANGVLMRSFSRYKNLPMYSSTTIAVHYDMAHFPSGRTFDDIERGHGVVQAATAEQSSSAVVRILTLEAGRNVDDAIRSFNGQAGVQYADHVGLRYPLGTSKGNVVPNDTYYLAGNQWYLDVIVASAAWGYGAGSVPIAVVDTGFDPNQTDLAPAVKFQEKIIGLKVYPGGAVDTDGHGTFTSGVAGAVTNNAAGFAGVSYNAPLLEFKIFTDAAEGTTPGPVAQTPDEAAAIREAVKNGAKVILLPFGGSTAAGPDPVERDAVEFAISSGVAVIAASGDDGPGETGLDFPAGYDGVISVGASAINDSVTPGVVNGPGNFEFVPPYSNAGAGLTMVAPGGWGPQATPDPDLIHFIQNLYTTQPYKGDPSCTGGATAADCYADYYGTSGAAAQVAGTASLMLSSDGSLTPAQIAYVLERSADDIGDPNQGSGRLNAQRALAMVNKDPNPLPPIPVPHPANLVIFAYTNSGAAEPVAPLILDVTYPNGIPVPNSGVFRVADIPVAGATPLPKWKIGVWYDANGDGKIGPGDYFGNTAACSQTGPCLKADGTGTITLNYIPTPAPSATPGPLP